MEGNVTWEERERETCLETVARTSETSGLRSAKSSFLGIGVGLGPLETPGSPDRRHPDAPGPPGRTECAPCCDRGHRRDFKTLQRTESFPSGIASPPTPAAGQPSARFVGLCGPTDVCPLSVSSLSAAPNTRAHSVKNN